MLRVKLLILGSNRTLPRNLDVSNIARLQGRCISLCRRPEGPGTNQPRAEHFEPKRELRRPGLRSRRAWIGRVIKPMISWPYAEAETIPVLHRCESVRANPHDVPAICGLVNVTMDVRLSPRPPENRTPHPGRRSSRCRETSLCPGLICGCHFVAEESKRTSPCGIVRLVPEPADSVERIRNSQLPAFTTLIHVMAVPFAITAILDMRKLFFVRS